MNVGNFQTGAGRLQEALESLQRVWGDTSGHWRDANSTNIEEHHLRPIREEVNGALAAIGHLATIVQAASRELDER
jgi:hypothetical protein